MPLYSPDLNSQALIPHGLFYNNQEHTKAMREMMIDFINGEHLLLMGNQGIS